LSSISYKFSDKTRIQGRQKYFWNVYLVATNQRHDTNARKIRLLKEVSSLLFYHQSHSSYSEIWDFKLCQIMWPVIGFGKATYLSSNQRIFGVVENRGLN